MQAAALTDLAVVLSASGRTDEAHQAATEAVRRYDQKGNVVSSAIVLDEVRAAAAPRPYERLNERRTGHCVRRGREAGGSGTDPAAS
jgi:endonuclease/exonuclease/phosphatase family metal-dependent hydrolase